MLEAILNGKKGKAVFRHFCALFMLRELTSSQLNATDATRQRVAALFKISFDVSRMSSKPWKLEREQYEMPQRLSATPHPVCSICP
jgi:hypothetical protein